MVALNWAFGFPYAPNEPIREQAFELVQRYYRKHFPDTPHMVHSATPTGARFDRSRTRNELVTKAAYRGIKVIALVDADTLIHPDNLRMMLDRARPGFLGKPMNRSVDVALTAQQRIADDLSLWPRGRYDDPGAAWVIEPFTWLDAGGMDENFTGWGGEDSAFEYLFKALGGTVEYGNRPAVKTSHPQARRGGPGHNGNLRRNYVCEYIAAHPELAREWLTVRKEDGIVEAWIDRYGIPTPRSRHRTPHQV